MFSRGWGRGRGRGEERRGEENIVGIGNFFWEKIKIKVAEMDKKYYFSNSSSSTNIAKLRARVLHPSRDRWAKGDGASPAPAPRQNVSKIEKE